MSFFRSDDVSYFRLVIPRESAWDIMNRLGTSLNTQASSNYFISVHRKPLSWLGPSSITFVDVKMHSIDSKVSKNTSTKKKSTNIKSSSQKLHTTKSLDFGTISMPKQVDTQHRYSTTWSDKLIIFNHYKISNTHMTLSITFYDSNQKI